MPHCEAADADAVDDAPAPARGMFSRRDGSPSASSSSSRPNARRRSSGGLFAARVEDGLVVIAYDDAVTPTRDEGALHEKVIAQYPNADAPRAPDADALSEFVGFASAAATIAGAFGDDDGGDVDDRKHGNGRGSATTTLRDFCVTRLTRGRCVSARVVGTTITCAARASETRAPRWKYSDEDLKAMLARVVATYETCVSSEGKCETMDRIAVREAWTRALETAEEALRASAETTASEDATGERTRRGFEKYPTFHGTERVGDALDVLSLTSSKKSGAMDARTASTLGLLRRDVSAGGDGDDVKHAYVKPGHDAWVCVSASKDERAYVVVENTKDTLLRAVRDASEFGEDAFGNAGKGGLFSRGGGAKFFADTDE